MHIVNPVGIIMADTGCLDGTREFLDAIGAVDWNIPSNQVNSDAELLVEVAGRTCYKSFGTDLNANLTRVRADHADYIGNILATKHGSVLEHSGTTVGFANVSRIFTHELVRHRAGCAYSQESMRFVRLDDIGMYIPTCIQESSCALTIFEQAVQFAEDSYKLLVKTLITDDMPFSKKKEITSAIRRIAPSGHATNIVVTANHRAWRHLFELRTADGVEEEIGVVFYELSLKFKEKYPNFYQDMEHVNPNNRPWQSCVFEHSKI